MKFQSTEQALRFSFNISERVEYTRMDLLKVRETDGSDALSPTDLHAQAAMIHNQVCRLCEVERNSIFAQYAKGNVRSNAIRELAGYLYPLLAGGLPNKETVQIVICHWATRRPSIRMIAQECAVSYRTACRWRSAVLQVWMPLQLRAVGTLDDYFSQSKNKIA